MARHARLLHFPYAASLANARLDALWDEVHGERRDLVMDYHELRPLAPPEWLDGAGRPRQRAPGFIMWQQNYYEPAMNRIRAYIANNPLRWAEDGNNPAQRA